MDIAAPAAKRAKSFALPNTYTTCAHITTSDHIIASSRAMTEPCRPTQSTEARSSGFAPLQALTLKQEVIDLDALQDIDARVKIEVPSGATFVAATVKRERATIKREPGVMSDIIEIDDDSDVKIKAEPDSRPSPVPKSNDRLLRLEKARLKLAKEIEEAERIAEMKRKMDALEAEIEAARGQD